MRIVVSRRFATVAAAFVVTLGASGWVIAQQAAQQIPAADGQFYACVRIDRDGDEGKLARLVAATEPCRRNETRVHWGATGPRGLPGVNGTNGAPGTNGTNGTNGTSVTMTGIILTGDARCPNGGVILADANGTSFLCNGANGSAGGTRADGPCFDNTNRYVNCGNGTVTDTVTGLIWLKQSDCIAANTWAAANVAAAGLKNGDCSSTANPLTDGSSPGDWRLPTKDEWSATIAGARALNCGFFEPDTGPMLTDDAGTACLRGGVSSFAGDVLGIDWCWSSSSDEPNLRRAFAARLFLFGAVSPVGKDLTFRVWPVRSGAR